MPTIPYSRNMEVDSDGGMMVVGDQVDIKPHNHGKVSMPHFLMHPQTGQMTSNSSHFIPDIRQHMNIETNRVE